LKLLSFLKTKHWIYKELRHFQKFICIKKWWKKKVMYLNNYKHLLQHVAKKLFHNSFIWKRFFWEKILTFLFYSNHASSLYPICTLLTFFTYLFNKALCFTSKKIHNNYVIGFMVNNEPLLASSTQGNVQLHVL
jgi:hypothetical protein